MALFDSDERNKLVVIVVVTVLVSQVAETLKNNIFPVDAVIPLKVLVFYIFLYILALLIIATVSVWVVVQLSGINRQ